MSQVTHLISDKKGAMGPQQLIICPCINSWATFITFGPTFITRDEGKL